MSKPNELSPALLLSTSNEIIQNTSGHLIHPIHKEIMNDEYAFEFESIRKRFVRNVYSLLLMQLLIVLIILATLKFHQPTKNWVDENNYMIWVSIAIFVITVILLLLFSHKIRRRKPSDIIFFILFSIALSLLLAFSIKILGANILLISVGISCIFHTIFILFSFQFKINFSGWFGAIIILSVVALILGISTAFLEKDDFLSCLYASIASSLFSFYILFSLKLVMDNEYKYTIKPNECCFAALNVYLDVFKMFTYTFKKIFSCLFGHPHHSQNSATQTQQSTA